MLNENIRNARKTKGFTQEDLASRLYVTRQTISKWEKGLSVPDADKLAQLSEVLEIPVATLLGATIESPAEENAVVEQLARLNEQLAIKNRRARRVWKGVIIALVILFVIPAILTLIGLISFVHTGGIQNSPNHISYECVLDEESYTISIGYNNRYRIGNVGYDCPEPYDEESLEEFELSFDDAELEQRNQSIEETDLFIEEVTDQKDVRDLDKELHQYFEERGGTVQVTEQTGKPVK